MKLDDDAKLVTLFWYDSLMKEDFRIYGDVVIFDTTYCTNKYNLICAPLVGINNHWNTTMFGCAFKADEKVESFVWVLEQFKEAMKGIKSRINFHRPRRSNCKSSRRGIFTYNNCLTIFNLNVSNFNFPFNTYSSISVVGLSFLKA